MSPDQAVFILAMVTVAWTLTRILRGPIGEALARRIGGDRLSGPAQDGEVAELRTRLAELEERVDFTERVLLQERQAAELRQELRQGDPS
jgi:hypothetical protein